MYLAGYYLYVTPSRVDFIYSHRKVFNWGKDIRRPLLQRANYGERRRWKTWSGDFHDKGVWEAGWLGPRDDGIPRAVAWERKKKNEHKKQWTGDGVVIGHRLPFTYA